MSHTNHTQYYELPQYVGSDIINPLVDTNGAYETIDTTLHNIAAEAGQGTSDIAALQSKVGNGVFDTTAQNATGAVNELVAELDTAETGVKARLTSAESDIDTLQGQMVTAQGNIVDLQNNKASTSDVNAALALKANQSDVDTLSSALHNGNWRVKINDIITATGDGVKTFTQLFDEMYASLAALQASLPATKAIRINAIFQDWETRGSVSGFEWLIGGSSPDTHIDFQGFTLDFISTNVTYFFRVLRASGSEYRGITVASDNTVTYNNYSANVPDAGAVLELSYTIYEQD